MRLQGAPAPRPANLAPVTNPRSLGVLDITLGFHESCHRNDYVAYLGVHRLPDPPKLAIDMTVADFEKATAVFGKELKAYFKAMEAESVANTDEVGHCKSTWVRTRTCFQHTLP